jgi:hypothetical protein
MSCRHTSGWDLVGFSEDPTPGDPDKIRDRSRQYNDLSSEASQALALFGIDTKEIKNHTPGAQAPTPTAT